MSDIFTPVEHKVRHQVLHTALLELLHDYLVSRGTSPTVLPEHPLFRDPIRVLLDWSTRQTHAPEAGAHQEVESDQQAAEARLESAITTYQQKVPPTTSRPPLPTKPGPKPGHPTIPTTYEQVPRPPETFTVGENVWWLRKSERSVSGTRTSIPTDVTIQDLSDTRVKVTGTKPDGTPFEQWVRRERLRQKL